MSLIDIELKSQKVREQFSKPSSNRSKLLSLSNFLNTIITKPEQQLYTSYYSEFEPELRNLIHKKDFCYFTPEEIEGLINIISYFKSSEYFADKKENLDDLILILDKAKGNILFNFGEVNSKEETRQNIEKSFTDSINIVLIENGEGRSTETSLGAIEKLKLDCSIKNSNKDADKIEFSNLVEFNDSQIIEQLNEVVTVAELKCNNEGIKTHTYNFNFYFDRKDCVFTGKSIGIGALSLVYNAILINEFHKYYFKFKDDVVFTSEVDKYGNLLRLEEKSLRIKLQSIFYSPYKKFVISEDNIVEAKKELVLLNEKYPHRKLGIIPIRNFEGVFKNLDIVEVCKLNINQKVKAYYQKYHTSVNWALTLLSILIILFFIGIYLIPRLDRNPVNAATENDRYVSYNKYGIKVWESEAIEKTDVYLNKDKKFFDTRCIISDLENDGRNEILYLIRSSSNRIKNRTIYCYDSNHSLKWKYQVPEHKIYYDRILFEDTFLTLGIYAYDFNNDGFKEIICSGQQGVDFPFLIMKLDHNGKLLSEYWNSGFLDHIELFDIEGDGKINLVTGDCNNKFDQAAIAIFDPNFIYGNSPFTNPLRNGVKGVEKYYILFPKSILCLPLICSINNVKQLLQYNNQGLDVYVYEGYEAFIIYKFNNEMKLLDVEFSTPWINYYESFVTEGKTKPVKDLSAYAEELKKQVKYWDGDKFVNYPVMNKNYLSVKNSRDINEKAKK
jgi:hypothetical protein